ncbi:MAG: hypothetical protein CV087_19060 [Candidatus Brocadia sp. WS118]|nr:MAG: hypothetical protein CV087_19060 [Candidatus Brocadia sp. WS118]
MKDFPLVSVIIPLYNKRAYVNRAIKSIQVQTYTNWEIIIVNDGSTDGSTNEIPRDEPRIRLLHQDNKGPGAARNLGIFEARGKYVSFLDADDEWLPSFLETGIILLEDSEIAVTVVCTGYVKYPEKIHCIEFLKGMTKNISISKKVYEINEYSDIKEPLNLLRFMWTCALIIRTVTVKKLGGFFDRFKCLRGEDLHLELKLIFNERIAVIPEPHCIYHTEASHLDGGGKIKDPNLELVILDLDDLLNSCPGNKRPLLMKILQMRAHNALVSLALDGKRKEAKEVLNKNYLLFHADRKKFIIYCLLAETAPVLPFFNLFWRRIKKVLLKKHLQNQLKKN